MQQLRHELKSKIIAALNLGEITAADIKEDEALFGAGLGLDSIDALDLVSMLEREYGIRIEEMETARQVFASYRSLEQFVLAHRR